MLPISLSITLCLALTSCERDTATDPPPPAPSADELLAAKVTTGPTIDGVVDAAWAAATPIEIETSVWDIGEFEGYGGDSYSATVRALYDDTQLYILAQWDDPTLSDNRQCWYFDADDSLWVQESGRPTIDNGTLIEPAHYEDKLSFIWNIDESVPNFASQGCMTVCHTGVSGHPFGKTALKYTNAPGEAVDMWHWKLVRTNAMNQADDQYTDDTSQEKNAGRHGDTKTAGGYSNNVQTVQHPITAQDVEIPLYYIPGRTEYHYILQSEIDAGTARMITALNADGSLVDEDGTVLAAADFPRHDPQRIPSVTIDAFTGSRGDLVGHGVHDGGGWTVEIARAFETGDLDHDVQWSDRGANANYDFGFAIFDNAQIAHATSGDVYHLRFEQ